MTRFSVLDLVPVREGGTLGEAFAATTDLARAAESLGCDRFWVAEHHAMDGIAGGATSVVLAHIGNATSRIRIGSGGIMLPNHTPFQIAEQFGTLDALFPGRIDLGLGRAPGAGPELQRALRKNLHQAAEYFPQDVMELRALLTGDYDLPITATPGLGAKVELWMLGSSLFGAQLAAKLGLPYAFAAHFAPDHLDAALAVYRRDFQPSEALDRPHQLLIYLESLRKTAAMDGIEVVLGGHGPAFSEPAALVAEREALHERRAAKIEGLLADGPATAHQLAERMWGNVAVTQAYLTLSEVLGHLDLLVERGRVKASDGEKGPVEFELAP